MKNLIVLISLAACCLFSTATLSQTIFTGVISNDWADAGNWSNGLPAEGNDATILPDYYVYNYDALDNLGTISNFGTIINQGSIVNNGTIDNFGSGYIENNGYLHNYGTIDNDLYGYIFNDGTIDNDGEIDNDGNIDNDGAINNWYQIANDGTITNDGVIYNEGSGTFGGEITNNGDVTNNGEITNDGYIFNTDGVITNFGVITNNLDVNNEGEIFSCALWIGNDPQTNPLITEGCGCTDPNACNFDSTVNIGDGSCIYPEGICDTCSGETDGTGVVVDNDADDDGVCDDDEIVGCQDPDACNYDPLATDEGECIYVELFSISGNFGPVLLATEAYSYPGLAGSTYEWTCTAGAIQTGNGTNEIEVIWGETGVGQVCVTETYAEGCTGDQVCAAVTVLPTNVQEIAIEQITVYPNPASTSVTISTDAALLHSPYRITDAQGKLVMEGALRNTITVLNTDQLSNGQYTLAIISDEAVITKSLIIQK